jgi:drug/metabolite transporter (DMT)-like permease
VVDRKGRAGVLTELSLILAAVFWGTNYAATKYAAEYLPQLLIVAIRFTVGGLLLLLVLRLLEPGGGLERKDVLPMLGLGCLGVATAQTAFTFGISLTSASNTGLVFATARRCGGCCWVSPSGWRGPPAGVSWAWPSLSRG